jgi:hypothetical protein
VLNRINTAKLVLSRIAGPPAFLLAVELSNGRTATPCLDPAWFCRVAVATDHTKASGTLASFPALIHVHSSPALSMPARAGRRIG